MWEDIGGRSPAELAEHDVRYRAWAAPKLRRGEILGLIAEDRRRHALASGVVWLREGQPRPGSVARREPYLMSMFTEPRARGRGLASAIVREFARLLEGRGFPRIELHASVEGRPVYERLGFTRTYEMRLWFDPERARAERRRRRLATRRFREARGGALRGAPARPGVRRGRAA